MKILIIGNIGSGKTTLGKKIQELTGFKFVQIDELREKYLKAKVSEEYLCLYEFLKSIENDENVILEFTGVGCHKFAVKRALELSNDYILFISCTTRKFSTIKERIANKKYTYGNLFNIDINNHANFVQNELEKDEIEYFWKFKKFKLLNVLMDTKKDIESNLELIKEIINKNC